MKDLVILAGAPGSGKSTICQFVQAELKSPYIDFGWLREWHLLRDWSNRSQEEEDMAFANLVYILRNYLQHGYKNILVTDLKEDKLEKSGKLFSDTNNLIVSLILNDDEELKRRVLGERDSGFKNWEASLAWNRRIRDRANLPNEIKMDNTAQAPVDTARQILDLIR